MLKIRSLEGLGIVFAILAFFSFSLLDTVQKTAIVYYSVFQILFIKYIFVLFLSFIESRRKKNYFFYKSKNIKLQILRGILSIIEAGCFILSFRYLSLADAHSVGSLTPVIVVALSAIILKEHVSVKVWIAIFAGFIGVLIIMRPGLSIFDYYNPEITSYTDEFWNETLLGKLIPFSVLVYVDPKNTDNQSETWKRGYTAVYERDIKFPRDGDGPFQLVYASPSYERDSQGAITGALIYKINKEYNPNQ